MSTPNYNGVFVIKKKLIGLGLRRLRRFIFIPHRSEQFLDTSLDVRHNLQGVLRENDGFGVQTFST